MSDFGQDQNEAIDFKRETDNKENVCERQKVTINENVCRRVREELSHESM